MALPSPEVKGRQNRSSGKAPGAVKMVLASLAFVLILLWFLLCDKLALGTQEPG
jgi:hypothetical protein